MNDQSYSRAQDIKLVGTMSNINDRNSNNRLIALVEEPVGNSSG
jgi:hypothetical protein